MTEHPQNNQSKPLFARLSAISFLIFFALMLLASYGLTSWLYRYTGQPPEFARLIINAVLGLLLLVACFMILSRTIGRRFLHKQENAYSALRAALAQIAQGNFDVALDPGLDDRRLNLVDDINAMARSLGTLETMRQDFVSNVSHEIQSPLTSISGFAELLQNPDLPVAERQRYARIIEVESKRLSSLSENMLRLSTLDDSRGELTRQEFRLDVQLQHIALALEPQWSAKGLNLGVDLAKCSVCGNADLLSQVWTNLLQNAIKFTPNDGSIAVTLALEGAPSASAAPSDSTTSAAPLTNAQLTNTQQTNAQAVVRITDTGLGIAPKEQIHIFERFYKVDKARDRSLGGNGLGLSIAKRIVELHGGSITVASRLGEGTSFTVVLPLNA